MENRDRPARGRRRNQIKNHKIYSWPSLDNRQHILHSTRLADVESCEKFAEGWKISANRAANEQIVPPPCLVCLFFLFLLRRKLLVRRAAAAEKRALFACLFVARGEHFLRSRAAQSDKQQEAAELLF